MMKKLAIPLSLAVAATLAACAGTRDTVAGRSSETGFVASAVTVPASGTVRAGAGRVAFVVDPNGPVDGISSQRLTVNMQDGSTQFVDWRGKQVAIGEKVVVRSDSALVRDPLSYHANP